MNASIAALRLLRADSTSSECVEKSDAAEVTFVSEIDYERERVLPRRTHVLTAKGDSTIVRTWSLPDGEVNCHSSGRRAEVDLTEDGGLILDIEIDKSLDVTSSVTTRRTGDVRQMSRIMTVQGSRQLRYDTPSLSQGVISLNVEVSSSEIDRSFTLKKANGAEVSLTSLVSVDEESPLSISIEFEDGAWVRRTLKSGKVVAQQRGDSSVEMEYDNVVYTADGGCLPESGTIAGKIFQLGESEPIKSFEVSFADGAATIGYSDGTESDYVPEKCDLE
jgi:hypothetical protein